MCTCITHGRSTFELTVFSNLLKMRSNTHDFVCPFKNIKRIFKVPSGFGSKPGELFVCVCVRARVRLCVYKSMYISLHPSVRASIYLHTNVNCRALPDGDGGPAAAQRADSLPIPCFLFRVRRVRGRHPGGLSPPPLRSRSRSRSRSLARDCSCFALSPKRSRLNARQLRLNLPEDLASRFKHHPQGLLDKVKPKMKGYIHSLGTH
jgi:hypothetical protein